MSRAANVYRRVDLESAPPAQIVVRLFDRFAKDAAEARGALAVKDIKRKAAAIDHAMQIVIQLKAALDHGAAPELCGNLASLYTFVLAKLAEANATLAIAPLDHAADVMAKLGDAFAQVRGGR